MGRPHRAHRARPLARVVGAALLLAATVLPSLPNSGSASTALVDPALRWGYLSNGAGYLILENHAAPAVGIVAVIPGGSGSESWANQGASHFLEHLLFNGTQTRTQEQIYDQMDLLGTYHNASTRATHVVFMILAPSENCWDAFAVQTDMLFHSTLPPEKVEKERGIILEELARDASSPDYAEERILDLDLFGPTGYGLPTLGSDTSIETIARDEIQSFYERNYSPERMTFVLIGDLDPAAAIDSLEARVGSLPALGTEIFESPAPPAPEGLMVTYHVTGRDAPRIRASWIGPDPKSRDFLAFQARFQLSCEGEESPLRRAIEEAWPGATQSLAVSLQEYPGFSIQSLDWVLTADVGVEGLVGRLNQAVASMQRRPLGQEPFEAWRRRVETEEIFLREKPHYYGIYRGDALAARGLAAVANELPALRALTLEDLDSTSLPLGGDPLRVSVLLPSPISAAPGTSTAAESSEEAGSRSSLGAAHRWERFVLSNGIQVLARSGPESEVLAAHLFVRDRSAREPEGRAGMAELLHSMLGTATVTQSAEGLALELDRVGAQLTTADSPFVPYDDFYSVPEFSYVRFQSLDRYARTALPLLAEIVSKPRLQRSDFETAQTALLRRAEQSGGSSRATLDRQIASVLFEDRPGGVFGTPRTLEPITFEELTAFAEGYLDPRGFLLAVASGMPADSLRGLLESSFGHIPVPAHEAGPWASPLFEETAGRALGSGADGPSYASLLQRIVAVQPDSWDKMEMPASPVPLLLEEVGSEQSQVALIRLLQIEPEERAALVIANRLLSDRLAFQVREREGLAYSIGSSIERIAPGTWTWTARAGTRPENSRTVLERFFTATQTLRDDPASDGEIRKSAASLRGRGLMRRITRLNSAYAAGLALLQGEDPDSIDERERKLDDVPLDELNRLLEKLEGAPGFVAVAR